MSNFLFGEIVEPSTRALIYEDLDEFPEYPDFLKLDTVWNDTFRIPQKINTLFFIDSKNVRELVKDCVLHRDKPIYKVLGGGIEIYQVSPKDYMILYYEGNGLNLGQMIEELDPWILAAQTICTITSDSIFNFQNHYNVESPPLLIRALSNSENYFGYKKLVQPNLVTGIGAHVLSYCIHHSYNKCTLFVIYMHAAPLDSYNNNSAVLELFGKIGIPFNKHSHSKIKLPPNNLYM